MLESLSILLRSAAFWSGLIAVLSAVVMRYANVPDDIWIPITSLLGTIVIIFTGHEVGNSMGKQVARSLSEMQDDRALGGRG